MRLMRLLVWNTMIHGRTYMWNGQRERTAVIADRLWAERERYDVIVLVEVFTNEAERHFRQRLAPAFPHQASLPRSLFSFVCGGVLVLSRWRITGRRAHIFHEATGADWLASKGVLWLRLVDPRGAARHLLATHTQAHDNTRVKEAQFRDILALQRKYVPADEPVLIVGDLNYDYYLERPGLLAALQATKRSAAQVTALVGALRYSADPERNALRGLDGMSNTYGCGQDYYCQLCWSGGTAQDPGRCARQCAPPPQPEPQEVRCVCCQPRMMDYAVIPPGAPRARRLTVEVHDWKAPAPLRFPVWKLGWFSRPTLVTRDLSDHFPVTVEWE